MFTDFSPQTDLENLVPTLNKYGVAVLTNIFQHKECDDLKRKIFKHLNNQHNIQSTQDYYRKIRPLNGGLIHSYGLSLLPEVLELKTDERTIEPFRRIWNEPEVTTSFDGLFIGPPPEETNFFFNPNSLAFHTDQSSDKKEKCCIQAFINLEHTETGDGCLSVLTHSHNYHAEFFEHFKTSSKGKDWFKLKQSHIDWFIKEKSCQWNTICAPKGSMVFWDSRTIHMGTLPRQDRPCKDRWRFLVYVCYTPAHLQSVEDTKLKQVAYVQNRMTAHWPYGVRLFDRKDDDLLYNKLENLTPRQRKFLGV